MVVTRNSVQRQRETNFPVRNGCFQRCICMTMPIIYILIYTHTIGVWREIVGRERMEPEGGEMGRDEKPHKARDARGVEMNV